MRITVKGIKPQPELLQGKQLPLPAFFVITRKDRKLEIAPNEMAIISEGEKIKILAPSGSTPECETVTQNSVVLKCSNEIDIYLRMDDVHFSGSSTGFLEIWATFKLLDPEDFGNIHPLVHKWDKELSLSSLIEVLTHGLNSALCPVFQSYFARIEYIPGMSPGDAGCSLKGFFKDAQVGDALRRNLGLALLANPEVLKIRDPEIDDRAHRQQQAEKENQQRKRKLQESIANTAVRLTKEKTQVHAGIILQQEVGRKEIEKKKIDLVKENIELEKKKCRAKEEILKDIVNTKTRIKAAEAKEAEAKARKKDAEAEEIKANARKKNAEAEEAKANAKKKYAEAEEAKANARKQQAEAKEAELRIKKSKQDIERQKDELEQNLAKRKTETEEARFRLSRLEKEIAANAEVEIKVNAILDELNSLKMDKPIAEEKALGMLASWRAHNAEGVVIPQLSVKETLPTGTMLDVAVAVTRDAYVYVLVKESTGSWVCLVPDTGRMMGIKRSNFQKAEEVVIWPGINKSRPDLPFWALDPETGTERLIVIASIEELKDIDHILKEPNMESIRKSGKPLGVRGLCNPVHMIKNDDQKYKSASDYHRVLSTLVGNGCVFQETVINHVGD